MFEHALTEEEWQQLETAAGLGIDRLREDDLVTVTVRIPEQFYEFSYPRVEWEDAVKQDRVPYLMDWDLSDMEVDDELYGPDGNQVPGWV